MEDDGTRTFLGLTDIEWHAFGYGLKEGFRFWKRTPMAWEDARRMASRGDTTLSPGILNAITRKYHYYIIGFDLPEDTALLACILYLASTNMPLLVRVLAPLGGVPC